MVTKEYDILNWILDESGCFTFKSVRNFFWNKEFHVVGVNSFGLHLFIPLSRTLVL